MSSSVKDVFKPRARMLLLLGDELIRDDGLAVFELVKNAYDADATECVVSMELPDDDCPGSIRIEDNGDGMSLDTIKNVWLEPGTDFKKRMKSEERIDSRFERTPLGDKGVGRFSVHKLGNKIQLITRAKGMREIVVKIDWGDFSGSGYLADIPVEIHEREPEYFKKSLTGTVIEILDLRSEWTRGDVRRLHRSISSICSPFDRPDSFQALLEVPSHPEYLAGLLDPELVKKMATFKIAGAIEDSKVGFEYEFIPPKDLKEKLPGRLKLQEPVELFCVDRVSGRNKKEKIDLSNVRIGRVTFEFYIFDLDRKVLKLITSDVRGLKTFLSENGGIRVYRDGMRVFDFGEQGNDWLDLGGRRVNIPASRLSNNQVLAAVNLDSAKSQDLIEKTNREGFLENPAYRAFRESVLFAVSMIEIERNKDKLRMRKVLQGPRPATLSSSLGDLRGELEEIEAPSKVFKTLERVEKNYQDLSDNLIMAAGNGLTMGAVVHEVEKQVKNIRSSVRAGVPLDVIADQVETLAKLVDGVTYLYQSEKKRNISVSEIIKNALFSVNFRLQAHGIRVISQLPEDVDTTHIYGSRRLLVSSLINFIDNSIYWLDVKWSNEEDEKLLLIACDVKAGNVRIVVGDNGPGFEDDIEIASAPFFSRKLDGMGLGLHIAAETADRHGGKLEFPDTDDIEVPSEIDGALICLTLPRVSK